MGFSALPVSEGDEITIEQYNEAFAAYSERHLTYSVVVPNSLSPGDELADYGASYYSIIREDLNAAGAYANFGNPEDNYDWFDYSHWINTLSDNNINYIDAGSGDEVLIDHINYVKSAAELLLWRYAEITNTYTGLIKLANNVVDNDRAICWDNAYNTAIADESEISSSKKFGSYGYIWEVWFDWHCNYIIRQASFGMSLSEYTIPGILDAKIGINIFSVPDTDFDFNVNYIDAESFVWNGGDNITTLNTGDPWPTVIDFGSVLIGVPNNPRIIFYGPDENKLPLEGSGDYINDSQVNGYFYFAFQIDFEYV